MRYKNMDMAELFISLDEYYLCDWENNLEAEKHMNIYRMHISIKIT